MFGFCACILGPGEHSVFTDVMVGVVRDRHQAFLFYTLVKSRNMMVQETQHFFYYVSYFIIYYCCILQAMPPLPNTWNKGKEFSIAQHVNWPIKVSFATKAVINA